MKRKINNLVTILFYIIPILIAMYVVCVNMHVLYNNTTIHSDNAFTAIIIEPRKHRALEYVLHNFLENLDERWNVILFHGNLNKEYAENIADVNLVKYKNRLKLVNLNVDDLKSHYEYSTILLSKKIYEHIPTEIFLVFQTDTVICSKYKDYIYKFIEYDYVGAPTIGPAPWNENGVGNGGLSLRRKSKMLEIIDKCYVREGEDPSTYRDDLRYEDLFFAFPCDKVTEFRKPSFEEAKYFAVEKVYNDKSFGIHKAYAYNDKNQIKKWCPAIDKLTELQ